MMTPARIVRLVGILGLLGWLGMVGWVAKTSQAQNGGPAAQPAPKPEAVKKEAGPPPPIAPAAEPVKENAAALALPKDHAAPPPIDPLPAAAEKAPRAAEPLDRIAASASPDSSPHGADDPEKSAQSFMERSQKEAEAHLKALTAEAEQLRTRLAKLDSGIKKWQSLVSALNAAQHGQPVAAADEPGALEPVAPGAAGARADKKVKWASASAGAADPAPQPAQAGEPAAPVAPLVQPAVAPAPVALPAPAPR